MSLDSWRKAEYKLTFKYMFCIHKRCSCIVVKVLHVCIYVILVCRYPLINSYVILCIRKYKYTCKKKIEKEKKRKYKYYVMNAQFSKDIIVFFLVFYVNSLFSTYVHTVA